MHSIPFRTRATTLLVVLFAASGCAALIYEIVWFQLLELVIGSTAASLAVILGTFMGGLCLGSLALPRIVGPARHPLRVYAALEIGTAILGVAVLFFVPVASDVYAAAATPALSGVLPRAVLAALCLLPPTVLIGATFPAIARWLDATRRGIASLGLLYGANIVGAVAGCLLAGFYLLRVHDMGTATFVAAAMNGAIGTAALLLAARHTSPAMPDEMATHAVPAPIATDVRAAHIITALSGFTALGAEAVWTRVFALRLGPTVYTFSIILAVILAGLALGSSVVTRIRRAMAQPRVALGVCQMLLVPAIALPAAPFATSIWFVVPSTLLWGASFPLALAAANGGARDTARVAAGIYAANTLGGIVGAVALSVIIVPHWGTQQAQRLLIATSTLAALVALLPIPWPAPFRSTARAWIVAGTSVALVLGSAVRPISANLVAWGRQLDRQTNPPSVVYVGEGANSSVAVTETSDGVRAFHVAGKVEASTDPQDLRLERMLAHYPALIHPNPRSVLVVGFGAGITAGTFLMYPSIERVVICEIEPIIPRNVGPFFARENLDVLHDPRVQIVYDDARHYVLTSRDRFDIITSDPIHPWVKGSATLYTREYYELVKRLLNPGGVVTEWVPIYESREAAVESEVATFLDVFPNGTLWGSRLAEGGGYDLILVGQDAPTRIDVDALQARMFRMGYLPVARSLVESGFGSILDLFSAYVGDRASMAPALKAAAINTDRNLRLQYLAGFDAPAGEHERIYAALVASRAVPDELFVASAQWKAQLGQALFGTK